MTSPYTSIPHADALSRQPQPQPLVGGVGGGVQMGSSPSAPSPLTALLPQIASTTSGLGLTPGSNPFLALQPGSAQAGGGSTNTTTNINTNPSSGQGQGGIPGSPFPLTFPLPPNASLPIPPGQGQGQAGSGSGSVRSVASSAGRMDIGLDQTVRGLDEGLMMINRALEIQDVLDQARRGVFTGDGGRDEELQLILGQSGGSINNLQVEYSQILNSLYLLSQSTQFGALPLTFPSNTSTTTNPSSSESGPAKGQGQGKRTTAQEVTELTGWCETRAALEFGRREGVKAGSRVVLDILGGRGQ